MRKKTKRQRDYKEEKKDSEMRKKTKKTARWKED